MTNNHEAYKVVSLLAAEDAHVQDLLNTQAANGYRLVSAMQLPNGVTRLILCADDVANREKAT